MDFDLLKTIVHADSVELDTWTPAHAAVEAVIDLLRAAEEVVRNDRGLLPVVSIEDVYHRIATPFRHYEDGEER